MWKPSDLICILHTYTQYSEHRNNIRHALYMYIFGRLGHGGGRKKKTRMIGSIQLYLRYY